MLLAVCGKINSQIVFSRIPENLQLIPRDKNNTGTFTISGKSYSTDFDQIRTTITDDKGQLVEQKFTVVDANGNFEIEHHLKAALTEYELNLFYGSDTEEYLYKKVTHLVCGDVFLIAGQSNAACPLTAASGGTIQNTVNYNAYCRAVGFCTDWAMPAQLPMEMEYIFARPSSMYSELGFAGTWGMQLQNKISRISGVPVCIVNGARSGSPISFNLPSHTPSDTGSLDVRTAYDRAFKKIKKLQLEKAVKAVFWYQGETDAAYSREQVLAYTEKFKTLCNAWKTDYVNIEKIFVIQIHPGCGGTYNGLIAEQQRNFNLLKDVIVMSSAGTDTSERSLDGCHFTRKGYNKIADKLLPLVLSSVYHFNYNTDSLLPPMVKYAYTSAHNVICIEFDKNITVQEFTCYGRDTAFLKDHFYGPDYSKLDITSLSKKGNKIYLTFKESFSLPEAISYVPNNFTYVKTVYTGPWILNENGTLGAYSFSDFKIESNIHEIKNNNPKNMIHVFPNPSAGCFKVVINGQKSDKNKVTLLNHLGQVLEERITEQNEFTFDIRDVSQGIYFVKVTNELGTYLKKVVVK